MTSPTESLNTLLHSPFNKNDQNDREIIQWRLHLSLTFDLIELDPLELKRHIPELEFNKLFCLKEKGNTIGILIPDAQILSYLNTRSFVSDIQMVWPTMFVFTFGTQVLSTDI